MPDIVRFSVSLEDDLLGQFDTFCTEGKFATRSEAVRHLIREKLVSSQSTDRNSHVAASLTLVYDHHKICFFVKPKFPFLFCTTRRKVFLNYYFCIFYESCSHL